MGKLIATTQATIDGVINQVGEWVQGAATTVSTRSSVRPSSGGLVLGRQEDLQWAGRIFAEPVGQVGGHGQRDTEVRRVQRPLREYSGTRPCLEGDLDAIPRLKDEVDGDLFMHGER